MKTHHKIHPGFTLAMMLVLDGSSSSHSRPPVHGELPEFCWLPNCVNSQSGRGAQASEPIRAGAEQWQALKARIDRQENWDIKVDDSNFIQAIDETPVMRFRYEDQLQFIPDERLIHVRSASQLGLSDLGANANRVETLRDQVTPQD